MEVMMMMMIIIIIIIMGVRLSSGFFNNYFEFHCFIYLIYLVDGEWVRCEYQFVAISF